MSSDDGWVLREVFSNGTRQYTLEHYFAGAGQDSPVGPKYVFETLEDAVNYYNQVEDQNYPSEFGLSINLLEKETKVVTKQYMRKPFSVDAVQVTEENMQSLAEWCQGDIRTTDRGDKFIKVRVHNPLTERQTKAFVGDWVLYAGKGYKVYTDKAFKTSFDVAETNYFAGSNVISIPGHGGAGGVHNAIGGND